MTKSQCEQMLDKEAERVAKSILQLVNSINFNKEGITDEAKYANKVAYTMKEIINTEVTKQFIPQHETQE